MTRRAIRNLSALFLGIALGILGGLAGCGTVAGFGRDLQWASEGLAGGTAEQQAAQDKYRPVKD